ncbi:hypothetical protein FIV42_18920 [Persicimonas caeni]|uniref:Penicillin-binding protein 1A n=1 Tax=Persicimonas caeni TaxID=2292766 RepID=A0A4Y6PXL7_PERCE|nr:transglycosylase domain-containing protein [Persicimonas caeni]QDG52737.1 hypothetical protein FIV42_18920 [Persicimonas caeni]QED33959.1 hypothetical protein FRD00_18915 [Persicimonas caeni]
MDRFSKRTGGLWLMPLRLLVVLAIWLPVLLAAGGGYYLAQLADEVPQTPDLERLVSSSPSAVETRTGWRLAGRRASRPIELYDLSPVTISAFLAAEDAEFFEHDAYNAKAIVRAFLANMREGDTVQGASTITQQLAKRFASREKTLRRKVKELLIARRLEATYSKTQLLETYLNTVYFGEGAFGISQASWTYFGKSASELEVAEAAVLAGLLPAPSRYNPVADPERAKSERDAVLRRMAELELLSEERARSEVARPVEVVSQRDVQPERMPYAASSALRALERHFDDKAWAEGGYTVVMSHSPVRQARARRSVRASVEALDRRQGWRGPLGRALDAEAVDSRLEQQPTNAAYVLARVVAVERERAMLRATGEKRISLALGQAKWAAPAERDRHYKRPAELEDLRDILQPNDLVTVRRGEDGWALVQPPSYEGAFVAIDSRTGGVWASVGGFDADQSIFHRAEQGCRQPGSVFKPIVYSEAISQGLTAATMLADLPKKFATGRGTIWQPKNADRDFKGYVILADALAWSRNIPTVHLMEYLGRMSVVARARKLGVRSELDTTSSVALGASCVRPVEMASVYAAFQRGGRIVDVSPVAHIRDRAGDVLVDREHFATPDWSTAARLDRLASVDKPASSGVSSEVAFIITRLLRRVVTAGTAHELPDEWQVAGKTGTTNEFDAWFVGFDGELTAASWIGSDKNERALGNGEHGATVAMPVFEGFYGDYVVEAPALWQLEPPERVVQHRIDARTGLRSRPGEPGVELPFIQGSAPTELAPTRGTRQAEQIDSLIHEF